MSILCQYFFKSTSVYYKLLLELAKSFMRILVNTISTKKHTGGAFQIAYNFLLKTLEHPEVEWCYFVSADLDETLDEKFRQQSNYYVFPTQPDFLYSYRRVAKELRSLERKLKPNVVYSITAPSYFTFEAIEVMRFTNPWVTHPNKYSWTVLSQLKRLKMRLYCWNQRRMMRKGRYFVTQTEITKQGIMRITGMPSENVCVVKNVLPTIFASTDNSHINMNDGLIHIACVAAPMPHKNLDIIPEVLLHLKERGFDNVQFHITIPQNNLIWQKMQRKMAKCGIDSKGVVNHGRMSQMTLVDMYRRCTFCFLPTLLEVFSVTTIEAMFFDLKIVATDFSFNREVLGNTALYYAPMDAIDAAEKLIRLIDDNALQAELSAQMKQQLIQYNDYDQHFNTIVKFLQCVAQRSDFTNSVTLNSNPVGGVNLCCNRAERRVA